MIKGFVISEDVQDQIREIHSSLEALMLKEELPKAFGDCLQNSLWALEDAIKELDGKDKLKPFWCTRNDCYPEGQASSMRKGFYVLATSEQSAIKQMKARFPDDKGGFTVTSY